MLFLLFLRRVRKPRGVSAWRRAGRFVLGDWIEPAAILPTDPSL
ncbi:MAG: hypothetical protein ACKVX7_16470 [Planctomycetota bacterium]